MGSLDSEYWTAKGELDQANTALDTAKKEEAAAKDDKDRYDTITKEKQKALEDAKKALDSFDKSAVEAAGAKGFFDSMNYGEEVFGTVNNETGKDYTVMGGAQDATNLNNMLESLKFIDKCNEIRRKEGLGELKVSLELMAKSQYDANNSAYSYSHLEKWGYGENLFWGSSDVDWAFDEWYTKEKALYEADPVNNYMNCLHYLNIIRGD